MVLAIGHDRERVKAVQRPLGAALAEAGAGAAATALPVTGAYRSHDVLRALKTAIGAKVAPRAVRAVGTDGRGALPYNRAHRPAPSNATKKYAMRSQQQNRAQRCLSE